MSICPTQICYIFKVFSCFLIVWIYIGHGYLKMKSLERFILAYVMPKLWHDNLVEGYNLSAIVDGKNCRCLKRYYLQNSWGMLFWYLYRVTKGWTSCLYVWGVLLWKCFNLTIECIYQTILCILTIWRPQCRSQISISSVAWRIIVPISLSLWFAGCVV